MNEKIGLVLAEKVAEELKQGNVLAYGHRDYCGTGLSYTGSNYCYGKVWEGYLDDIEKEFPTKDAFVYWLSQQDDESLSGKEEEDSFFHRNQRITKERLGHFVGGI